MKKIIHSDNAPKAVGTYSQAVQVNNIVYLSGQIPLVPATMTLVEGDIVAQIHQAFDNLTAVAKAAGGDLSNIVRLGIYLTDLGNFAHVNEVMMKYFKEPFPARSTIEVSGLPKGASFEVDAIMFLENNQ